MDFVTGFWSKAFSSYFLVSSYVQHKVMWPPDFSTVIGNFDDQVRVAREVAMSWVWQGQLVARGVVPGIRTAFF